MTKAAKRFGAILAFLVLTRVVAAFIWPTINDVRTGATPEYSDIQPQRFARSAAEVFESAVATGRELGWEITRQDAGAGVFDAVATSRLWRFKDDVTVTVSGEGDGAAVNVHSRSRIGKGDLGANARRIRSFQAGLARRL